MTKHVGLFFALLITALAATTARAHDARPLYVEVTELSPGTVRLTWRTPPVTPTGEPAQADLVGCTVLNEGGNKDPLATTSLFSCPPALRGSAVRIDYALFNPSLSTLIRVRFASGEVRTAVLPPGQNLWPIPEAERFDRIMRSYLRIGVEHIVFGIDHLLFLVGLLVIAGTPRRAIATITGFTLAHSATIALVALDLVKVSVPAVETVIALSILLLAVEIARDDRGSVAWRYPIIMASAFGLVHGAGFAAALAEIGLPQTERIAALVAFNVGVELGQIAFALAAFGVVRLVRYALLLLGNRADGGGRILSNRVVAYGLGVVSAYWFIERFAEAIA